VRVLHHSNAAWQLPQPLDRLGGAGSERLAASGVKELLLISQDTSFYGIDQGERGSLAKLLRALNRIEGLEWIRMLYLYPTTIGDDVLEAMAESEKVCRYVDLPLQHASDAVLKRMKRPGTRASYERLLDRIRQRVPASHSVRPSSSASRVKPQRTTPSFNRSSKRSSSIMWASSRIPTRKAPLPTVSTTTCPPASNGDVRPG
jgi:hypothetical protein